MNYESLIALRQITHRKGRGFLSLISFISVAGIAVGVMALIVVLSVMSGFERELKLKIVGANPHLLIVKSGGIEHADEIIAAVESLELEDIVSIAPYVEGQVIIRSESNAVGAIIKGVDKNDASVEGIRTYVKEGSLEAIFERLELPAVESDTDASAESNLDELDDIEQIARRTDPQVAEIKPVGGIALGNHIARNLRVHVGDNVHVISPYLEQKKRFLPRGAKTLAFEVKAIYEFGMNSMDSSLILVSIDHARELFKLENKSSGVAIRVRDVFLAEGMKETIRQKITFPYWVQSWIDVNKSFFSALQVEKNVMTVLLFLIILVAGFNIVSTLIMVVMEKTKDIGILKALGATDGAITRIFLFQGTLVGILGVFLGTLMGLAITLNINAIEEFLEKTIGFEVFPSDIYYFNQIPAQLNPEDVVVIVVIALVISILAGLYPARRAAALNPVEALRYE